MRRCLCLSAALALALGVMGCKSSQEYRAWDQPYGGTQTSPTLNLPTRSAPGLKPVASVGLPGRFPSQVGLPSLKEPVSIQGNASVQTKYGNAEAYQQLKQQRIQAAERDSL